MIKKIDRYICDRCGKYEDFYENTPTSCSPKSNGWKTIYVDEKRAILCLECHTKLVNDFLKNN